MFTETCRGAGRALAFAIASLALPAAACGICIEDRVAAVYDQPTVDRAVVRHQQVAFFALNGSVVATPETRRAVIAALDRAGIKGTAHVSLESATASVAYDPRRASVASLAAAGDRALASRSLKLEALRITGADGKLREP
ncbi:MAG: hypothetical protein ACXWAU_03355 [Usitatibacter sp.]